MSGEWMWWNGGAQPVADGVIVQYVMRNNETSEDQADYLYWTHKGKSSDIVAYRVIKVSKGEQSERESSEAERQHNHYHKDVSHLQSIDVYRVLSLYGVTDPNFQHGIKKLLCAGNRGHKELEHDVQDVIDTLERWKEMRKEDNVSN